MAVKRRHLRVLGIPALLLAVFGCWYMFGRFAPQPQLHKSRYYEGWEAGRHLLLRSPAEEPGSLLLRALTEEEYWTVRRGMVPATQPGQPTTYLYVPSAEKLKKADRAAWDAAVGESICTWGVQILTGKGTFEIDHQKHKLLFRGHVIATAAATVRCAAISPSKRYVAVLSVAGLPSFSIMPFLGGGGPNGQRYHEVFRVGNGKRVGKPVPLPLPSGEHGNIHPCWSPDERYVVYTDTSLDELCIVHVELTEEELQ